MKTKFILSLALVLTAAYVCAQTASESVRLSSDQVPAVVKQAYEKEFGAIPEDGDWKVRIVRISDSGRIKATPLWYSYSRRGKGTKVDLRFSPEGELKSSKGKPEAHVSDPGDKGKGN